MTNTFAKPLEGPKLTTQQQIVVDYLQEGRTLTNMVALSCLGVGSLSSRIAELRKLGYEIEVETDMDRFERHYRKYRLAGGEKTDAE